MSDRDERDEVRRLLSLHKVIHAQNVAECDRLAAQVETWKEQAEFLDGRMGLPNDPLTVGAALSQYVLAEDADCASVRDWVGGDTDIVPRPLREYIAEVDAVVRERS